MRGPQIAGQGQFSLLQIARTRTLDADAPSAQGNRAMRRAPTQRATICIRNASRTTQGAALGFHHRRQHAFAGFDAQA